jgi:hypothetical protein
MNHSLGVEGRAMDVDLGGIRPNWEFLPPGVRSMFEGAAGTALMIGLGICAIGFIIAGVRLLFARTHGMYGAGADAKTQFLWAVVGTLGGGQLGVAGDVAGGSGRHDLYP